MGMAMLGDKISADKAEQWGLIWKCVEDEDLPEAVEALLAQFAAGPTQGYAAIKQAMYGSAGRTLEAQLDVERDTQRALGFGDEYREGVAAFIGKRPPRFGAR